MGPPLRLLIKFYAVFGIKRPYILVCPDQLGTVQLFVSLGVKAYGLFSCAGGGFKLDIVCGKAFGNGLCRRLF